MTRSATTPERAQTAADRSSARLVAAGLMGVQAIALVGVGIWSGFDGASARAWSFAATLIVLAACVAALAWLLLHGKAIARTPTLLWNALLIPAGFTVGDGGAPWVGWLIIGLAVGTFVATLVARPEPSESPEE